MHVFVDCRYLSEFLYAWLMSTLSRADSSQMAEERILEEQLKGRSSKKTKKKKKGTPCWIVLIYSGLSVYDPNQSLQRNAPFLCGSCNLLVGVRADADILFGITLQFALSARRLP